jgi:hypothetical protein
MALLLLLRQLSLSRADRTRPAAAVPEVDPV